MHKKLHWILIITLLAGTIIAWYHVIKQFAVFYGFEGTIFKVQDCLMPNPVTTPCFYGSFGFLIALIIAIKFFKKKPTSKSAGWFSLYLLAGSIFAWFNAGQDLIEYYSLPVGGTFVGCSGVTITNPFSTACFMGACLFLIAFIISLVLYKQSKK